MVSIKKIIFRVIIISLFLIASCEESFLQTSDSQDIIDKCKCREYCFGEIIYDYCLIEESKTPQDCQSFIGLYLGQSYDGSVKYYFNEDHLDKCYKAIISKQTTADLCSDFPNNYSYDCFYFVGKKNFEPKHCKELPYSYKSNCYLYISNNKSISFSLNLCDELKKDDRTQCYANIARNKDNSKICLQLEDNLDKMKCHRKR